MPGRTANDIKNYWNSHLAKTFPAKPAASASMTTTEVSATPPTVVHRPQAHRVSMRTRELLRQMFSSMRPNANPPASSSQQPPTDFMERPHPFPAPEPSSSQPPVITGMPVLLPAPVPDKPSPSQPPAAMKMPHPVTAPELNPSQPPVTSEMPHPFTAPEPSSSDLSWLPTDRKGCTGEGGGGEVDLFLNDVDFEDLFSDPSFWDWMNGGNGSPPPD